MPVPSTLNKCTPTAVPPPPRYRAPKRHFLPAPPLRRPPSSSTPSSLPARTPREPSRLETEPLISLLFQSEEHLPTRPPPLRPNRLMPPTRTERIMLRRPSPSPRQKKVPLRRLFRFPRDLSLVTSLGLIALIAVCSLALVQIGNATARRTCPTSGGKSRPSTDTTQHITDGTLAGSASQGLQRQPP